MLSGFCRRFPASRSSSLLAIFALMLAGFLAGCGSSSSSGGPIPGETTKVTLLLSSTANDQVSQFTMQLESLTLTNSSGQTVNVLSQTTPSIDFIHLNGQVQPLVSVDVPQDTYVSAAATLESPAFTYIYLNTSDDSITVATDSYGYLPEPPVVNLSAPIAVEGTAMGLNLDLQVSQSESLAADGSSTYSITPVFDLTPVTIAATPTSVENGEMNGVIGQITAVNGAGFTLQLPARPAAGSPPDPAFSISVNANTVYQGISGLSQLAPNMSAIANLQLQHDGSLAATSLYVPDLTAGALVVGPAIEAIFADNALSTVGVLQVGPGSQPALLGGNYYTYTSATVFQISSQFINPGGLPFTPSFVASSLVPGQNLALGAASVNQAGYTALTSATLMPQTLDGTVDSVSTSGSYTIYTLSLASYDLFTDLGGFTSVQVYANSGTTTDLTTSPISTGGILRCNGFIFNDSGTLRMVAAQLNDGVAF